MIDNDTSDEPEDESQEVMRNQFHRELQSLINRHSMENGSDTPDFILASYMANCLDAFNTALTSREMWYGREVGSWHPDVMERKL